MDLSVRMVLGETVAQKAEQLQHLLREPVIGIVMAAQSRGGGRIRAGRSSQSKIDAARRQCFEHAELFGDHQRRMVRLVNSVVTLPGEGDHAIDQPNHAPLMIDRKSTRLNSSHVATSYAVFCLKKKNTHN